VTGVAESEFDQAWADVQNVDGWLTPGQGRALFDLARRVTPGQCIVEIGSHHGRSTILMARGKQPGVRLTAVDPWQAERWGGGTDAFEAFTENVRRTGVAEEIDVFRGVSADALSTWDGPPIGLLYIDGAHDFESVLIDIDGWEPYVSPAGAMVIHDAFSSTGVTRALLSRHFANRKFRFERNERTLALYHREDLSSVQALASAARQAARLPYFARNLAVKVAMRRGWTGVTRTLGHTGSVFPY
jgi:predicted O-methyltransferase YrrM